MQCRRATRSITAALALLVLGAGGSAHGAENCLRPQAPIIPSGANAEREAMLTARADVDAYLERMQAYVDCLARESEDASAEADRVVDEWNAALQNFERR